MEEEQEKKENNIDVVLEPPKIVKKAYLDVKRIQCSYCPNNEAERRYEISSTREAAWLCTSCGRRVR